MSSSKTIDLSMDFAACVYLFEAQIPIPPPHNTVYVYTVYLFTQVKWESLTREKGIVASGNSSQSWVENTNMTYCISSL
jgi:hypothetical protein